MSTLANLVSFYRLQLQLVWTWRPGKVALLKRVIVAFIISFISLLVTVWLLPGVTATGAWTLAAAVIALAALNLVLRPIVLAAFGALSIIATVIGTLLFQVLGFLLVSRLVPDFHVAGWLTAFVASFVYAFVDTALGALLAVDEEETFWTTLMQQVAARHHVAHRSTEPGVLIVQIDGLAAPILRHQVRAGRVPFLSHLIRTGAMRLDEWEALLPSQTSASQAGILHGNNSFIPAFRWWEKDRGVLMVSNHPADAAAIVARASNGEGLLSNDGASIGNLVSGDAARSYITMATIKDRSTGVAKSRAFNAYFASPTAYLHAVVRGAGEVIKEYVQASRERRAQIEPRMHRGMPYPVARAATNVLLRSLSTSLVIEEMYRGTPVIYVDYTDYDEIAHHSGPERAEALDALDGVDRTLRSLARAIPACPRPYRLVVLSDHGQSLGATFRQRYGESLHEHIASLMGNAQSVRDASEREEEWGALNALATEAEQAHGATGAVTRRALRGKTTGGTVDFSGADGRTPPTAGAKELPELVVCASGNLALIFFPRLAGRVDGETIDECWPGLIDGLRAHPGIGVVLVRSRDHGAMAIGPKGVTYLDEERTTGQDPVAVYGGHAADGLRRVDSMEHCGDLVIVSTLDIATDEVAAFEELIGSHGGLGGPQTQPFILHPSDWPLQAPIVGAEGVYREIRGWLEGVGIELGHAATSSAAGETATPLAAAPREPVEVGGSRDDVT